MPTNTYDANNATDAPAASPLLTRDAQNLLGHLSVDLSRPRRLYPFSSANITGRSAARERRRRAKMN